MDLIQNTIRTLRAKGDHARADALDKQLREMTEKPPTVDEFIIRTKTALAAQGRLEEIDQFDKVADYIKAEMMGPNAGQTKIRLMNPDWETRFADLIKKVVPSRGRQLRHILSLTCVSWFAGLLLALQIDFPKEAIGIEYYKTLFGTSVVFTIPFFVVLAVGYCVWTIRLIGRARRIAKFNE